MNMLRRVRVVLDFETEILEIREDRIRARHEQNRRRWGPEAYPNDCPPEPDAQQIKDFRLLQAALRADPEALARWVEWDAASILGVEGLDVAALGGVPPWDSFDLLLPVIETLPPGPRHRMREAIAKDTFLDYAEDFLLTFDTHQRDVRVDARPASGEPLPSAPGPGRVTTATHRQVRVELDYETEIGDVSMENARARHQSRIPQLIELGYTPDRFPGLPSQQEVDDNRLLQEALLADPVALDAWIELQAFIEVEAYGIQWLSDVSFLGEEEIIEPLIELLPPGPRDRFREAIEQDALVTERIDELFYSAEIQLVGARVNAVS